jgi:hypothetical protein
VAKFTRGLDQIATLPGTPALRSQQIKLQVGLANALYHTKGFSAAETKTAFNQARAMIERAEALGEHVDDPLVLYSILYGLFIAKFITFDGDAACALARQFLDLAEQQKATALIMIGHRLLGTTFLVLGELAEGLKHLTQASALYEPAAHRSLTTHLWEDSSNAEVRLEVGREVGQIARRLYDPHGSGVMIDVGAESFGPALARSAALLVSCAPIFEAGFAAEGAIVFTDIMLPVRNEHSWRMVEVKSTTSVKDYHSDDIAIQAYVTLAAGVPLKFVSLAHIDGEWVYPGDENYQGLLVENDLTEEAFARGNEVKQWINEARAVAGQLSEPQVRTGAHCSCPFECGFLSYCESKEPPAKYPIEWLPRLRTSAAKQFIETNLIEDLRQVPDEYLSELQQRVKAHTLSGTPFFDQAGAAAELAHYNLPAYFLDFETRP